MDRENGNLSMTQLLLSFYLPPGQTVTLHLQVLDDFFMNGIDYMLISDKIVWKKE